MASGYFQFATKKQDTDQTVIDQVPTDIVVDTSIIPAPIDTPTPLSSVPDGTPLEANLQSKTFKLCKSKGKEFATFDEALRKKNQ
jgi:hypothetical protein